MLLLSTLSIAYTPHATLTLLAPGPWPPEGTSTELLDEIRAAGAVGYQGHKPYLVALITQALEQVPDGLLLEFGVFRGLTINAMADAFPASTFHGFDSFVGLPEDWRDNFTKGTFNRSEGAPSVRANVRLHKGWFNESLPAFLSDTNASQPVAFLHMDADLYTSTIDVMSHLTQQCRLRKGTVIAFDELYNFPEWQGNTSEYRALREWNATARAAWKYVAYTKEVMAQEPGQDWGSTREQVAIELLSDAGGQACVGSA